MAKPTWITVNPNQGSGSTQVAISAAVNTDGYRTGVINITAPNFTDTSLDLSQYPGDCEGVILFRESRQSTSIPPNYTAVTSFKRVNAQAKTGLGSLPGDLHLIDPALFISTNPDDKQWGLFISKSYVAPTRGSIHLDYTCASPFSSYLNLLPLKVERVVLRSTDNGNGTAYGGMGNYDKSAYLSFINGINSSVTTDAFLLDMRVKGIVSSISEELKALATKPNFNLIIREDLTGSGEQNGVQIFAFASEKFSSDEGYVKYSVSTTFDYDEAIATVGYPSVNRVDIRNFISSDYSMISPFVICSLWSSLRMPKNITIETDIFGWISLGTASDNPVIFVSTVSHLVVTSKQPQKGVGGDGVSYEQSLTTVIYGINNALNSNTGLWFQFDVDIKDMTAAAKARLMALKTASNFTLNITVRS